MLRMFDFTCTKCENTFEELIDHDKTVLPCPECGSDSVRQLAAPRLDWQHMGTDPGFPSAYDKWAKAKSHHYRTDKGGRTHDGAPNLSMY